MTTAQPKTIRVLSTKYDGSPRDEWSAQLLGQEGAQLSIYVCAGTEEIVRGYRREIIRNSFHGLYWTDRWYNVWHIDRGEGVVFYANVAMPCRFDGRVLSWIDLDIDVVQYANGSTMVKDEQEFWENSLRLSYPKEVIDSALAARDELLQLAEIGMPPFRREAGP